MPPSHPNPVELTLVRTCRVVRVCVAYDRPSVKMYNDNTLIRLGIDSAMPTLRQYYGRKPYIIERQSVERKGPLAKVVFDLSPA
jgi:hypothetical protein